MGTTAYCALKPTVSWWKDDGRWLAKPDRSPNVALYHLQKSLHLWDDLWTRAYCACKSASKSLAVQARRQRRRRLQSTYLERNVTSQAMNDNCRDALFLLAGLIPNSECNLNESPHPDCTALTFGNLGSISPNYSDLLTWTARLSWTIPVPHHCSLPLVSPQSRQSGDMTHSDWRPACQACSKSSSENRRMEERGCT